VLYHSIDGSNVSKGSLISFIWFSRNRRMLISLKRMKQIVIVPQRLKKLDQRKFDAIPKFYKYGFLIKKNADILYLFV